MYLYIYKYIYIYIYIYSRDVKYVFKIDDVILEFSSTQLLQRSWF